MPRNPILTIEAPYISLGSAQHIALQSRLLIIEAPMFPCGLVIGMFIPKQLSSDY